MPEEAQAPTPDPTSAAQPAPPPPAPMEATATPTAATAAEQPVAAPLAVATAAAATDAVAATETTGVATAVAEPPAGEVVAMDAAEIEELLKSASFEDPSTQVGAEPLPAGEPFPLPNFQQVMADAQVSSIDLLRDVELNVKIELGRSRMLVEDVLKLGEGSVVELDKLAGDPVDVFVNDRLVARGEVLVLNESFCVRVNEIVASVKEEGT